MKTEEKTVPMVNIMQKSDFNVKKERKMAEPKPFELNMECEEFENLPNWAQSGIIERLKAKELPATINRRLGMSPFLSEEQKKDMECLLITPEKTTSLASEMQRGM